MKKKFVWPRIIFGIVLIGIWYALRFNSVNIGNPGDLKQLQENLVLIIQNSATETALLTAGLVGIVMGLNS